MSLAQCCTVVLRNQLFVILPGENAPAPAAWPRTPTDAGLLFLDWLCRLGAIPFTRGIVVESELPALSTVAAQGALAICFVELFFFSSHRVLHWPALYARVHKVHHEYKAPIALAALYAHPLEAFIGNTVAVIGPAFLVGMHALTFHVGMAVGFLATESGHSGHTVPFLSPRGFHDLHHERFNCNFGSFGVLDTLAGTRVVNPRVVRNKPAS